MKSSTPKMETRRFLESSAFDSFEVLSVRIYPVKSCQALEISPDPDHPGNVLNPVKFTKWGLEHDRRWAVVGREIDAKPDDKWHVENIFEMHPELARIKPFIERDLDNSETGLQLRLTVNNKFSHRDLVVPIRSKAGSKPKLLLEPLLANASLKHAEDEGEEASAWISQVLNLDDKGNAKSEDTEMCFRLVWMPPDCSQKCAAHPTYGHLFYPSEELSFAAKSQLHIANLASLDDLNECIKTKFPNDWNNGKGAIDIDRFRPNIVIRTSFPWEEDAWKLMRIGAKRFRGNRGRDEDEEELDNDNHGVVCRVALSTIRCNETTVHMEDKRGDEENATKGEQAGTRDKTMQPLKALKKFHADTKRKPKFGLGANRCAFKDSAPLSKDDAAREWCRADMSFAHPNDRIQPPSACIEVGDKLTVVQYMAEESAAVVEMGVEGSSRPRRNSADSFDFATSMHMADKNAGVLAKEGLEDLTEADVHDAADQIERQYERTKCGDGSLNRVGVNLSGKFLCAWCCQRFSTEKALTKHERFAHDIPDEVPEANPRADPFLDWWGEGSFGVLRKGLERISTPRCNTDTIRSLETAATRRSREREARSERTPSRYEETEDECEGDRLVDLTAIYCDVHLD